MISYVLIPYVGRPVRGQVLSLRQKEFIEAGIGQGAGPLRIMFSDLLPNLASTILVFFTLIIANNILTEAGLSFLGAGVRLPDPSWGNLIASGQDSIVTAPWLSLVPGMYAYASLTVTLPEAWTLPAGAVVRQGDAAYAVAVRDGKAVRVPVQAGVSDGQFVEVFARQEPGADGKPAWVPLTGAERFVASGAAGLGEGQAVAITEGK